MPKKIKVSGVIVANDEKWIYDWFDMEATSPRDVMNVLDTADGIEEVEVTINSGGGDVFAGSEIFTELKSYKGNVTTRIVGLAASAASVIAMAGDKVVMSPTAQLMIHNVWSRAGGDYRDMEHMAGVLKGANQTIANAYKMKTGKTDEELLSLMDEETWFTPQDALSNGFIDEVMFDEAPKLAASTQSNMLPVEIINKLRNMKDVIKPETTAKEQSDSVFSMDAEATETKFKFLSLKNKEVI